MGKIRKKNREVWGTWQYRSTPSAHVLFFQLATRTRQLKLLGCDFLWPNYRLSAISIYTSLKCVQIALYSKQSTKCNSKLTWLLFKTSVHLLSLGRGIGWFGSHYAFNTQLYRLAFAVVFPMGPVILPWNGYFFASVSDKFYIATNVVSN